MLTPGSLARSAALLDAHPTVGFVSGYPTTFTTYAPKVSTTATGWSVWPGGEWLRQRFHDGRNVISSPEAMMRRSVMDQLRYDEIEFPNGRTCSYGCRQRRVRMSGGCTARPRPISACTMTAPAWSNTPA